MDYYIIDYGLPLLGLILALIAQGYVTSTFNKYSKVRNKRGLKGHEVARMFLDKNGLQNVQVLTVNGNLTDHYDPRKKCVKLSQSVYDKDTIAALSVACHECGHALQDKTDYKFMRIRASLVPFVNFSSYAGYIAIILGIIFRSLDIIWVGIGLEMVILLFELVTLPVEFDASNRALKELESMNYLDNDEMPGGKKVLKSAAMTYVASVATTMLQILRLILIFGRRRD